ncbi:hypothetical protein GCM10023196_045180 [Actinoallomurus vinaceus]|uniref:Uncharacterized protein n=1 Tax=Actinoallomurus vinaceus TaxID=1080074 RepID=A0ABP8UEX7_9ACTN
MLDNVTQLGTNPVGNTELESGVNGLTVGVWPDVSTSAIKTWPFWVTATHFLLLSPGAVSAAMHGPPAPVGPVAPAGARRAGCSGRSGCTRGSGGSGCTRGSGRTRGAGGAGGAGGSGCTRGSGRTRCPRGAGGSRRSGGSRGARTGSSGRFVTSWGFGLYGVAQRW